MKKAALMTLVCSLLAGCGIKPGAVEPPSGENAPAFPRAYPDLSNDPAP